MKESTKQKILEYDRNYKRDKYKSYTFRVNRINDEDIIEYLDGIADKTNYIKELIRKEKSGK